MNGMGHNTAAGKQLRSFVERVERLNEDIAALIAGRTDVFLEAKGLGFCTKTMREVIKLRRMSDAERQEAEALLDLYKGALGMLEGTPLGDAARRRLSEQQPEIDPETGEIKDETPSQEGGDAINGDTDIPEEEKPPAISLEEARDHGRQAARDGKTVIENPYPAGDANRAAWDEGWCEEQGSDGMGIPAAWRRSKPKPPVDDDRPAPGGQP